MDDVRSSLAILDLRSILESQPPAGMESQPLVGKTNQQAWARLLDDAWWEEACPKRLRIFFRALSDVMRFYNSIEYGECIVERDPSEFRAQQVEHVNASFDFLDDALIMMINGPRTTAEFNEGVADSKLELTQFTRECPSLWRD